ncbi:sorbosone dehydrogenase family protein [Mesorhizobium sp. BE184]|uniref:PQQ-dependent sugar dehydrogenase n=1 Tax=Mesorhizobium sp. BE184 TaxID=2817714 RepID=UPI002863FD97|nr:sorbosone dehydrogenase family protein [Mesorhizobium sp. BE184]MDR7031468.1 glucose/arabinose dehydrogenase [Mesorhizobium sp. BE184]
MKLAGLTAISFIAMLAGASAQEPPVLKGEAAFGDWKADKPGVRRLIAADDLQRASPSEASSNSADRARMPAGARPDLPRGFTAEIIASGLRSPRVVRTAPNGDLFVADSRAGRLLVYRLGEDGKPTGDGVFAEGLSQPYGIAFHPADKPQWVYVASPDRVVRYPYKEGDMQAKGEAETVVSDIPSGGHWTRDIAFSADGKTLYVSVGSQSNVGQDMGKAPEGGIEAWAGSQPLGYAWGEEEGRANVLAFDADGKNRRVVATGLRNCSGMAVQPATQALWCVVNERDQLGDNVPFEYATTVKEGAFYGWPWYYIGANEDPRHAGARPDLAGKVTAPDVLMQAHSAPLNIAFYQGDQFPAAYKGDAFVTLHGSWNRGARTGYKVVRLRFEDGKPTGEYEDFMTGFVLSDAEVWGRPVGVAVARDGSLIVTEDGSGTIWRVSYDQKRS